MLFASQPSDSDSPCLGLVPHFRVLLLHHCAHFSVLNKRCQSGAGSLSSNPLCHAYLIYLWCPKEVFPETL